MKIVFILAFVLVCGLVLGEEKRTDFEEKAVYVADPKRHRPICKSVVYIMNIVWLFSLNSTVIRRITQRKLNKLLGFSTQ